MTHVSRRRILAATAGAAICGVGSAAGAATRPSIATEAGLDTRAARRGLFFGSAIDHGLLEHDSAYMAHVPRECGVLVGEASFKWADVHPEADSFTFDRPDALMSYARRHGLHVRGHTLLWHEANPEWLEKTLTPANGEALLRAHIAAVVGHFRGHLLHWDVVNEVINPPDGKPLGLRDTLWLRALGPRYLDIAYHACAEADPGALRVLNEFGTDYALPHEQRRRDALLTLLADLKSRNIPVQAVGLQAHLDASIIELDQNVLHQFVGDIAAMGLKVIVTELDVRDQGLPADPISRDIAVAAHAKAWLDPVLAHDNVLGVLTWGLSDRRSWLNDKFQRPDKLPQRALPLDVDLRRKPMWTAIGAALDAAPARGGATKIQAGKL
jgi:endo-1,4-beta-xylanase